MAKKKDTNTLSEKDQVLVDGVKKLIEIAITLSEFPISVAKKIAMIATRKRNKGRKKARKLHPFAGVCEVSGKSILQGDANLDELTKKGYDGLVRWTCQKHNNSGKRSCMD